MEMELDFDFFKEWVKKKLKIDLHAYKEKQLHRRIATVMNSAGVSDLRSYAALIEKDQQVRQVFLDYITINVTEFYRNKEIFEEFETALREILVPRFKNLKIWSAACSIGAEPYSVSMIMERNQIKNSSILATDIDDTILRKAKEAKYRETELKNVAPSELTSFFVKNGNEFILSDAIKKRVQFKKHDLLLDPYEKNFHAVICRNVTIYFKNEAKNEVYKKINESLEKGGIFFTGATEAIYNPSSFGFRKLSTFLYEKV
ncbi:chemotaxis protein methyltransferase CheR [Proteiniclasticum ruminis]|uniref:protein-glutamate O-methyltransferase n=1 Tax=Proteiniclasticum ruminis TaxID=398199 RepID=A0A1G8I2A3_9CLOT|nr:chemotaxis protein methyltransferase CheR [Proteiniclasticum ruminis]